MGQKTNSTILRSSLKNYEWKYKYLEKNKEESSLLVYKNTEIEQYIDTIFKYYNIFIHNYKIEYNQTKINVFISFYKTKLNNTINLVNSETGNDNSQQSSKQLISFIITKILILSLNLYTKNKITIIKTQNIEKKFETFINKNHLEEYNKTLKLFKPFLKNSMQKDLIKTLFISVTQPNSAKLLANNIAFFLEKEKKKHNKLLHILKKVLTILLKLKLSNIKGIKISINGRFNGVPRAKKKILQLGAIPLQSINSKISYYNSTSFTTNGTFGIKVWICQK